VAGGAQIWLLDEPGNGLDSAALARLATAMAAHREAGGIVLAATHQPLGLIDPLEIAL
jgi:heme exporter protein A